MFSKFHIYTFGESLRYAFEYVFRENIYPCIDCMLILSWIMKIRLYLETPCQHGHGVKGNNRPCKFCRAHYTKTPQLRSQKCLPLLQLAYLQHHGRSSCSARSGQDVGNGLTPGTNVGRVDQRPAAQIPGSGTAIGFSTRLS